MTAPNSPDSSVTVDDIRQAAERLSGRAIRTPVVRHPVFDEMAGAEVFLKVESQQLTGSFKFRGGFNAVSNALVKHTSNHQRGEEFGGVVAYSSGNHAQGVACAAAMCDVSAVIVMPHDAPEAKVAATRSHGAQVVRYDRYTEDRSAIAEQIAASENRVIIAPYDNPHVIAGQGTVGLELFDQVSGLDAAAVCLGGGGLLAGCCLVAEATRPSTQMFGVEPAAGNDHVLSRAAGERVTIEVPRTIADGQQVAAPGELTWPITSRLATDFLTVSDPDIVQTMILLFEHTKLVVEPSGASALAAVLHQPSLWNGSRVGVTISGGNVSLDRFKELTS